MNISLDYDDTFTRDPIMWAEVAKTFQRNGHTVYGVTYRSPGQCEDMSPMYIAVCNGGIHATSMQSKRKFMNDKGIIIHVWIDDLAQL